MIFSTSQSRLLLQKTKRQLLQHVWLTRVIILAGFLLTVAAIGVLFIKPMHAMMGRLLNGPRVVSTFFTDPLFTLPSYGGNTNILFLGMGGGNHEGALLSDTIIFSSLDLKSTSVTMLSIPRDIWVASIEAKINATYAYGEVKNPGSGYTLIEDAVYEIVGQPIHYVVSLDFSGFKNLIDLLGGVDVKVEKGFVDEWYPLEGLENDLCNGDPQFRCRYETITFNPGTQHMDGSTALKYSRSRHAEGDEGNDFARSVRQQQVIKAIREKLVSSQILLNPKKLMELKQLVMHYIKVNKPVTDEEYAAFAGFALSFWRSNKDIKTISLETGTDDNPGFLVNPPLEKYDQWVLVPRNGDWHEFQEYFRQKLAEE